MKFATVGVLILVMSPLSVSAQRVPEIAPADKLLLSLPNVESGKESGKAQAEPKPTKTANSHGTKLVTPAKAATVTQPAAQIVAPAKKRTPSSKPETVTTPASAVKTRSPGAETKPKITLRATTVLPAPSAKTEKRDKIGAVLETKPDLPGTPTIDANDATLKLSGVKPRESSLSAINDGGRMMIYLLPLLLGVVGAIRLLAKYQQRKGHLPGVFATIAARSEEAKVMRTDRVKSPKSAGLFSALIGNFNLSNAQERRTGAIRLLESVPLGGANLHLVEIRGRSILIGATSGAITVLSEFRDAQEEEDARFRTLLEEAATNLDGLEINSVGESSLLMVGSLEEELRDASASLERSAQRLQAIR